MWSAEGFRGNDPRLTAWASLKPSHHLVQERIFWQTGLKSVCRILPNYTINIPSGGRKKCDYFWNIIYAILRKIWLHDQPWKQKWTCWVTKVIKFPQSLHLWTVYIDKAKNRPLKKTPYFSNIHGERNQLWYLIHLRGIRNRTLRSWVNINSKTWYFLPLRNASNRKSLSTPNLNKLIKWTRKFFYTILDLLFVGTKILGNSRSQDLFAQPHPLE